MNYPDLDEEFWRGGLNLVAGVDEAGRGPLAGPLFAAAVVLPPFCPIAGVDDSKKLSPEKRELIFQQIMTQAEDWAIGAASVSLIDRIGPHQATLVAMTLAVKKLKVQPQLILVDGPWMPKWNYHTRAIVKGDRVSRSIACASIIAKVLRDKLMDNLGRLYPQYGFESHKGYATSLHLFALEKWGPTPHHRYSFAPVRDRSL